MSDEANPVREARNISETAEALSGLLDGDVTESEMPDEAEAEAEAETEAAEETIVEESTEEEPVAEGEEVEPEVEEGELQPKKWTVKIDGQELEVTEDELTRGYQRDSDYRRKTAEIAEKNRALEAERQRIEQHLDQFIPALQAQIQGKFAGVDWAALAREDPGEYVALKAEYDQYAENINEALAEKSRISQSREREQNENHQWMLQEEGKKLVEKIPVFADPVKGVEVKKELRSYLLDTGYSEQEIGGLADSRAAQIAYKAMLYDKAKKAQGVSVAKAKTVPKVQKPGTTAKADPAKAAATAAKSRLKQTGKVEDLAAWLESAGIGNS